MGIEAVLQLCFGCSIAQMGVCRESRLSS